MHNSINGGMTDCTIVRASMSLGNMEHFAVSTFYVFFEKPPRRNARKGVYSVVVG